MLEQPGEISYNMNEVYLDDIYYHYLWTGDRGLLASLFPVIQGILSWEKRRLDPDDNALYESCLNTWISDSHWYSGGDCTQASAYMYRGYQLASEAAEAAGADPKPFRQEAERIRAAMNSHALDLFRGPLCRVHRSPWSEKNSPRAGAANDLSPHRLRRYGPVPGLPNVALHGDQSSE